VGQLQQRLVDRDNAIQEREMEMKRRSTELLAREEAMERRERMAAKSKAGADPGARARARS
jgi:hypothetical protein